LKKYSRFLKITLLYRIIDKLMKNIFILKDNILDKKLIEIIKQQNFSTKKVVNREINSLIEFFAEHFTNFNKGKA